MIDTKLKEYVESNIFPKYDSDKVDDGHKINHIKYVINRSLIFAGQYNNKHPDDMLKRVADLICRPSFILCQNSTLTEPYV